MRSDMSQFSSKFIETTPTSSYGSKGQNSSFQTTRLVSHETSGNPSTGRQSRRTSHGGRENIKLVPMKFNDLISVFQADSKYKDKSPVMINMKESEIDKIIEKQHFNKSTNGEVQLQPNQSPTSFRQPVKRDYSSRKQSFEPEYISPMYEQASRSDNHQLRNSKPPLGENQAQIYAMTGIQAYPMIGAEQGAFKARKRKKKSPKKKPRRLIGSEYRIPEYRSISRGFRAKSRGRSRRRRSPRRRQLLSVRSSRRPRRRSSRRPRRRSTVVFRRKRKPILSIRRASSLNKGVYCTPYPLCDYDCTPSTDFGMLQPPFTRPSRRLMGQSTNRLACTCTLCQEKLQFIQPGVCTQKKDMWTNEYAIIPKPQMNLIDPCKELDPSIYPRADRPCIRDGRGNPLTDCIGRPLRDPVGKRFLNFNANGSVMDTNFRGNFFTGQPPLCVKCPMPGTSCAPDTTHNWWMNCGYPVKANMAPFYNKVVAAENAQRRC